MRAPAWDDVGVKPQHDSLLTPIAGLIAAVFLLVTVGIGLHVGSRDGSLPALDAAERARDAAARTEAAALTRASALIAGGDQDCDGCARAWQALASESEERLRALGGLWDPWAEVPVERRDGLEEPAPPAEAPQSGDVFVAWLRATATRDLTAAAREDTPADLALSLASVAAGRLASAVRLETALGVDGGAVDLASLIEARAGSEGTAQSGTSRSEGAPESGETPESGEAPAPSAWGLSADEARTVLPAGTLPSPLPEEVREVMGRAVASWDCAAQTLPRLGVRGERTLDPSTVDELELRADEALSAGAQDARVLGCVVDGDAASTMGARVLAADLTLVGVDSTQVRTWALGLVARDARTWASELPALGGAGPARGES